jgi:hypothetical protein
MSKRARETAVQAVLADRNLHHSSDEVGYLLENAMRNGIKSFQTENDIH